MSTTKSISLQDCDRAVKECLNSEDYKIVDFAVHSSLLKITVIHNNKKKNLKFYTKFHQENQTKVTEIFEKFKKIVPSFDHKITPKIYYGNATVLLFEDLSSQDFEIYKLGHLNLDHLQVTLGVLAKFHAASLAYEEAKSRESGRIYTLDEEFQVNSNKLSLEGVFSLIPQNYKTNFQNLVQDLNLKEDKYRKSLCHGNLKSSNIMFKCKNGKPVDCKFINFQSYRYATPFYDVLQLIYFNTTKELRQHHLEELLLFYYHHLKNDLKKYLLKIETVLPKDEMKSATNSLLPRIKIEAVSKVERNSAPDVAEIVEILTNPRISREDCYSIVKNILGTTNYDLQSFSVTPLDEVNGYLGEYFKLRIKIIYLNREEILCCFIKGVPKTETSRKIITGTNCFFKEIFFYQTLVGMVQQCGISAINDCITTCYYQRAEDLIVFKDISMKHYCNLPTQIPFDYSLLTLTVQKLAKFHASFFILEEKMSQSTGSTYRIQEHFGEYLEEVFFLQDEAHCGAKLMSAGLRSILDVIELYPDLKTEKNQTKFTKAWPKLQEIFYKATRPSSVYRNVFAHGDLWTNNIMVQMEGEQPIDCCFVDFQCTRYCPPAHDFLSIMYLTTNRSTRLKHEKEMVRLYHDELARILASYNCNVNQICPYNQFVASIEEIRPQMAMQSIMYGMFNAVTSDEIKSFLSNDEVCSKVFFEDRKEYMETMSKKSEIFCAKLRECLLNLYDVCEFF